MGKQLVAYEEEMENFLEEIENSEYKIIKITEIADVRIISLK